MRQIAQSWSFLRLRGQTICVGRSHHRSESCRCILSLSDAKGKSRTGARAENQPGDYGS